MNEVQELLIGQTDFTKRIMAHLDDLRLAYELIEHEPGKLEYGVCPESGANSLIVKPKNNGFVNVVISATLRMDNNKLRKILGTNRIRFARPDELKELMGCLPGAVPPFGNLLGLPVLLDDALLAHNKVYFNCASHTITAKMAREDLIKANGARVASFH